MKQMKLHISSYMQSYVVAKGKTMLRDCNGTNVNVVYLKEIKVQRNNWYRVICAKSCIFVFLRGYVFSNPNCQTKAQLEFQLNLMASCGEIAKTCFRYMQKHKQCLSLEMLYIERGHWPQWRTS